MLRSTKCTKERRGGRSVKEEGASRRKKRRGGRSDEEDGATRRGKKINKEKKKSKNEKVA